MNKGFDANRDLSPFAKCLLDNKYNFVCRYYNINNPSKNLTYAEANYLSVAGLSIVAVWENGYPTSGSYFSYKKGISDGTAAYEYALNTINQPELTPIYFAVDYDATRKEVKSLIVEYFKGIVDAFNNISQSRPRYLVGVYGSGLVCETMKSVGHAKYTWLAQSTGWSGSKTYKDYNIKQLAEKAECIGIGAVKGDPDESPGDNEGSFKVMHLTKLLEKRIKDKKASVCDSSPTWSDAPKLAINPLKTMKWANDLEKDKFGCTRKDATGKKKFHGGIDLKASVGTDCYATEDNSTITAIGYGDDLGKYVALKFTKGGKTYGIAYCHLSKHDILKVGDLVNKGTVIGKTGKTGNVGGDAPHLHLEVHDREWLTYDDEAQRSAHSLNLNSYV